MSEELKQIHETVMSLPVEKREQVLEATALKYIGELTKQFTNNPRLCERVVSKDMDKIEYFLLFLCKPNACRSTVADFFHVLKSNNPFNPPMPRK